MKETFQTIINAGNYDLADITERIKTMYAMGELTEDDMKQLLESARANAKTEDSLPDVRTRIANAEKRIGELESNIATLTGAVTIPETDEWPDYVRPTSADKLYQTGAKITFTDGKHYTCNADDVVDGPDVVPDKWTAEE